MRGVWTFTDDAADPCGYEVGWEEQPDDFMAENARPVWPDGATVERVYRFVHRDCQAAAIAYSDESRL